MKNKLKKIVMPIFLSVLCGFLCGRLMFSVYEEKGSTVLDANIIYLLEDTTYNNYEEMKDIATNKNGFIKVNWCGNQACEDKIKEELGIKSRCIINDEAPDGPCVCCGDKAVTKIYFGKQY